ncbi:energy transducer TonB [Bryobacter aggregatus]|uniref:energy transducer TonB n=1 Tax=Bryobacter aggregatus TaxID=360054 RepID=UPI0004E0C2AB|nr:energy transducer TonB [Bryobacter aggregatus]
MKTFFLFVLFSAVDAVFAADQTRPIEVAVPGYLRLASGAREEGEVAVDLQIDIDGKVVGAKAVTGPERLRPWAQAAALKWRFEASMPGTVQVVFAFILQKGLTDPPAMTSIFTSPNRVVVFAERRDLVIIADPPLENMGKQKKPKRRQLPVNGWGSGWR